MPALRTRSRVLFNAFCLLLIAGSLLRFAVGTLQETVVEFETRTGPASDFYAWYTTGTLWNRGENPYDFPAFQTLIQQLTDNRYSLDGYYYPPQTAVLFGLLAQMPLRTAFYAWLVFNLCLLTASLALMARLLSVYRRIGLLEVTFFVLLLNTAFARSNIHFGQSSLLVCLLFIGVWSLAFRAQRQPASEIGAGILLALMSIKPTSLPLFLLYFAYQRRWRLVASTVVTGALITVLPLVFTGRPLVPTMISWVEMMRWQGAATSTNNPSPFAPGSAEMFHLLPLTYRLTNGDGLWNQAAAAAVLLALAGGTIWLLNRPAERGAKTQPVAWLDFALVSMLSLWWIYHRSYDSFLLFPGMLVLYIHAARQFERGRWRWAALLAALLAALAMPGDLAERVSSQFPALLDVYLWRVAAPFQVWAAILLFAALVWVKMNDQDA